ncbi:MAG: LysM peptidoglycan-binding domain-containing protein [Chlamydiales bacterium]|nr:LysM peptidoglycan-binding domain-containing protein [Chlamydiales bacterium]
MSRKDTILIAILVNVGVLVVLFISSIKHDHFIVTPSGEVRMETKSFASNQKQNLDPVDLVLSQYEEKQKNVEQILPTTLEKQKEENQASLAQEIAEIRVEPKKEIAPLEQQMTFTASRDMIEVEIKAGDVLEKIAKQYNTTVEEIKRVNQLSSHHLQIGQVIYVPRSTNKPAATPQKTGEAEYYIVKNGDNPWTIAMKNHLKIEELLRLNNLDESKAKKLKPGDKLRIK